MPEGIAEVRKEFKSLVTEAKAFFKDVGRRGISNIDDWSWRFLTRLVQIRFLERGRNP